MAVVTPSAAPHRLSRRVEKELHQTKVVIRRLPPDFSEKKLAEVLAPLPPHNYFYFAPGDPTFGLHGCARAYMDFADESMIVPFREQVDGLVLESEKGLKYRAVVEFAPYQGIPRRAKRRKDPRCGTIEQDSDYCAFLETCSVQAEPKTSIDYSSYFEELEANKVPTVMATPLVEYLKAKRDKRKPSSKAKVYVVEKKKKRSEVGGKTKPAKVSGGDSAGKEEQDASSFSKGAKEQRRDKSSRGKSDRKSGDAKAHNTPEASVKVVRHEHDVQAKPTPAERESTRPHTKRRGWAEEEHRRGGREGDVKSGVSSEKRGSSAFRKEQDSWDSRQDFSMNTTVQEPHNSSERREDKGRTRNRGKPDRPIYVPKARDADRGRRGSSKDNDRVGGGEASFVSSHSQKSSSSEQHNSYRDEGKAPKGHGAPRYYGDGDSYSKRDRADRRGREQKGREEERGGRGRGGGRRGRGWGRDRVSDVGRAE